MTFPELSLQFGTLWVGEEESILLPQFVGEIVAIDLLTLQIIFLFFLFVWSASLYLLLVDSTKLQILQVGPQIGWATLTASVESIASMSLLAVLCAFHKFH